MRQRDGWGFGWVQYGLHQIFERWDGRGVPRGLRGEAITSGARFAQVATLAVLLQGVLGREAACGVLGKRAGGQLDPTVTRAFLQFCNGPERLANRVDLWQAVLDAEPQSHETIADSGLDDIACAFGDLVDLKTPFTVGHASGVAELAGSAARELKHSRGAFAAQEPW